MKFTQNQLRRIIREALNESQPEIPDIMGAIGGGRFQPRETQPIADMDKGIAQEYAQDVVAYVQQEIVSQQAPALAGLTMREFLNLAAELAADKPMQ